MSAIEILRLRAALEFYAKAEDWHSREWEDRGGQAHVISAPIWKDRGNIARAALSSPAPQDAVIVPRKLLEQAEWFLRQGFAFEMADQLRALLGAPTRG